MLVLTSCTQYIEMPDINLVERDYPKPEEVSSLAFALAEPKVIIESTLTPTLTSGLIDRVRVDTKDISCYLNNEVNKILLSKGFTITDRFQSYDRMTFTEKRNTSALFYPEIIINLDEKSLHTHSSFLFFSSDVIEGRIEIDASVNIIMLEPLSGEKLWIKRLPIDEIYVTVKYDKEQYGGPQINGYFVPSNIHSIAEKIDSLFIEISEDVVESTEKYVEKHEFEFLDSDIRRLKGIKRY